MPPIVPGQPVPAITVAQLQGMTDDEFATYMAGLRSTPIDSNTYYNHDWDTQRLAANMPELNKAPEIVDPGTFAQLSGTTLYRTVNSTGRESAMDIVDRTLTSDVTTIGEGRMGDGFYFADTLRGSQLYGTTHGDVQKTATMAMKLNGNARIVDEGRLRSMLSQESPTLRRAVIGMKSGGNWSHSGLMAYAIRKGYNVVHNGSYYNVIDRTAATFSGDVIPLQ